VFRVASCGSNFYAVFIVRNAQRAARNPLIVTRQPAVQVGLFFFFSFHAKSHFKFNPLEPFLFLHLPMAFLAFNLVSNVPLVIKDHMFG